MLQVGHAGNLIRFRSLQSNLAAAYLIVLLGLESFVATLAGQVVNAIGHTTRMEALLLQIELLQLKRSGQIDLVQQANELRPSIVGQHLGQTDGQSLKVHAVILVQNRRHTGLAFQIRNLITDNEMRLYTTFVNPIRTLSHLHAVNDRIPIPGHVADLRLHLTRGHILALPPERVARPVLEEQVAPFVGHQHVARQERRVALHEHIVDDLLAGRLLVHVAEEGARRIVR